MVGIYKIENLTNGKIYIGQSIDIYERWNQHKYKAFNPNERGYNSIIYEAFRKYGVENFSFSVLEETSIEMLDERERFWITELNSLAPNGYNILVGGQKNRKPINKERFCSKCGKLLKQKNKTNLCLDCFKEKNREHIPEKNILIHQLFENNGNFTAVGRIYNKTGNAVVKWCKFYEIPYHSEDYKVPAKEKKPQKISVVQLNKETNEIVAIYESANAAARALGKSKGNHITEVCKGKNKSAYGYFWKYKDELVD